MPLHFSIPSIAVSRITPSSPNGLLTNLVGYWKFDEGSGTTLVDSSGNGYDLEVSGSLSVGASGLINSSINNNGTNGNRAGRNWTPALRNSTTFSVSLWVKRGATGTPYRNMVSNMYSDAATFGDGWGFYFGTDDKLHYVNHFVADTAASSGAVTDTASWHHVAMTYNSGTVNFYVDGSNVGSANAGTMNTAHSNGYFYVCENDNLTDGTPSTGHTFSGSLDELGYWARTLSSGDITTLYNGGSGLSYSSFTS